MSWKMRMALMTLGITTKMSGDDIFLALNVALDVTTISALVVQGIATKSKKSFVEAVKETVKSLIF